MPIQTGELLRATAPHQTLSGDWGDDTMIWNPITGPALYHGGDTGEAYDPNPYFDRSGGDRLVIEGDAGVRIRMMTTEDGVARSGGRALNFTGIERLHLGDADDTLNAAKATQAPAHDGTPVHGLTVYAGGGNDIVVGSGLDDFIDGGSGNDTIRAGGGWDFIQSSTGDDLIHGGGGNDNIRWGQGNPDEIIGNDTIHGGETDEAGGDLMNIWVRDWDGTGVKVDFVTNESGVAETDIGGAHSTLHFFAFENFFTHEGNDTVSAAAARIRADHAGVHFNTRWGDDRLTGSRGDDRLEGGEGRDTIEGGQGDDMISAADAIYDPHSRPDGVADVLIFHAGFGHDTIRAFDPGLDELRFDPGMTHDRHDTAAGILLTFSGGDSILLENVHVFG